MSVDWSEVAADVSEGLQSIQDTNQPNAVMATLQRDGEVTGPAYNPTFGPPQEFNLNIFFSRFESDEIDGTVIKQDDVKFLAEATSEAPRVGDRLVADQTYRIINATPLKPGGVAVLWTLQCRA